MDERIYTEIERLKSLRMQELRTRYRAVFGEDSRTAHKQHLVRQIAWRLQVQAQGDLSQRARQRALEIANDADLKKPGSAALGGTVSSPARERAVGPARQADSARRDRPAPRLPGPKRGGQDPDRWLRV